MSVNEKPGTGRHAAGSKSSEGDAVTPHVAFPGPPHATGDTTWGTDVDGAPWRPRGRSARLAAVTTPDVRGLQVVALPGIGEIFPGDDLAAIAFDAAAACGFALADGDIVVVTSKVVSKAEGRIVELVDVEPSPFAREWAKRWGKDPAVIELVLRESRRIVRQVGPVLITETHHGFVCANSGVDQSSSGAAGRAVLLPSDPDDSARRIRAGLAARGVDAGVVVSDTFGRPWREGQTDVALGVAGFDPIVSYVGQLDPHGHEYRVQAICVADELAAAAELVKGNVGRTPVAVIRGHAWTVDDSGTMRAVIRDPATDLFR
jgi:coenzyme F420-0:L-glutamate ligase/coenzyme F420-1:gamma-L-glutamate ligase